MTHLNSDFFVHLFPSNFTFRHGNASSSALETTGTSVPSRHRVKRGFWEGIEFNLASPSVYWKKNIGSPSTVGAEFGLTIRNELDMKICKFVIHFPFHAVAYSYEIRLVDCGNGKNSQEECLCVLIPFKHLKRLDVGINTYTIKVTPAIALLNLTRGVVRLSSPF